MMLCNDIDFDDAVCTRDALWLMGVETADDEKFDAIVDQPLCAYHKRVNELYYAKHHPGARVTFTRLNTSETHDAD